MSTVVFFHAHPDDEVLLTGGTMARLAAGGHRVVLVTATAGEAGLTGTALQPREEQPLGRVRTTELHEAARVLGCARTVLLGYPDSGSGSAPRPGSFATIDVEAAAEKLVEVLVEERADAVTGYDAVGGYGHPDHVHVHRVARAAAARAGTPALFEATVDRRALQRALRIAAPFTRSAPDFRARRFAGSYTPHDRITHCIDVRAFAEQKRAAMRAHASQASADAGIRTLERFLRLPLPVYRVVFGREWFVRVGSRRRGDRLVEPGLADASVSDVPPT
ncbi:MAG TPA: PIG-L family deacetylase [Jatrophihabitans sp.]|nr:PIG-L family deacetylase [Jatrophihabitans sp.]